MMNRTATALATLIAGTLVLTGCSGAGGKVSGNRDDIKVKAAISEQSHREPKNKSVCTSKNKKGRCTAHKTQQDGTKKVIDRRAKPALYCVELDNVNGKRSRDDRWYEVTSSVYYKMASKNEGAKVTKMKYLTTGCSR